jgi:hypothetical protein
VEGPKCENRDSDEVKAVPFSLHTCFKSCPGVFVFLIGNALSSVRSAGQDRHTYPCLTRPTLASCLASCIGLASRCTLPHLTPFVRTHAAHSRGPASVLWHRAPCQRQAPRQRASIGGHQVDEHMLQPHVSCVLDVYCICFIWMLQK